MLERGRASPDYQTSVAKTWQISIEAAEGACAAARPLLELLAFFSTDPLPMVVLAAKPEALPEGLHEELARDEAIGALKRFSLIQAEKDALTVHRLVQAVTCDGLDQATTQARAESPVRLVSAALPNPLEHTNWLAFGVLLPHALAAARVFNETAIYHQSRAAWVAAEPLLKHALVIREKTLPPGHPDIAQSLGNLAELYRVTSRHAEAEPLLKRAIAISKKALGPDHLDHLGNAAESRQPRVLFLRQHFVV